MLINVVDPTNDVNHYTTPPINNGHIKLQLDTLWVMLLYTIFPADPSISAKQPKLPTTTTTTV